MSSDGWVAVSGGASWTRTSSTSGVLAALPRDPDTEYGPYTSVSLVNALGDKFYGSSWHYVAGFTYSRMYRWAAPAYQIEALAGFTPTGVSSDGSVVVGYHVAVQGPSSPAYWSASSGVVALNLPPYGYTERLLAVSGDGAVAVGYGYLNEIAQADSGFVWMGTPNQPGSYYLLNGTDSQGYRAFPACASRNGAFVAGGSAFRPYRWIVGDQSGQPQDMGVPPGWSSASIAALSADGSIAVGTGGRPGSSESFLSLWTPALGPTDVQDYFGSRGIDFSGWSQLSATCISDDGVTVGGFGDHTVNGLTQREGFILVLPRCGSADFNHDGDSGTDLDIEDFFACIAGNCCPTCGSADFNGDGDTATDADIEAFFRVLAGGNC